MQKNQKTTQENPFSSEKTHSDVEKSKNNAEKSVFIRKSSF